MILVFSVSSCSGCDRTAKQPQTSTPGKREIPDAERSRLRVKEQGAAQVRHYAANEAPEGMSPPPMHPAGFFEDDRFIQGASLGLYMELPDLQYKQLFQEIKGLGATHVSLVVAWSMRDIRASTVHRHPVETVPDEEVRRYIRLARAEGLKVMLFPILHMERRRSGEWRGKLEPRDPERWWKSYAGYIKHYARIAQEEKVDIYSVGSELLSIEHEEERWKAVIRDARGLFSGKLTYSANWDHFDHVSFWADLDIAGMTGYFELSDDPQPDLAELRAVWDGAVDVIGVYPGRAGIPVMLTEVGYPSQVGSVAHPWDYTRQKDPDPHVQYLAFRAMYEAWNDRAKRLKPGEKLGLSGLFLWNWYG